MAQRDISRADKTDDLTQRIKVQVASLLTVTWLSALIYLAGIFIAEAVTAWISALAGAALHALLLVAFLYQAYRSRQAIQRLFYSSIALAPLTRLLSLVLPMASLAQIAWYLLIGIPLSLAAILVARTNRVSRGMVGLRSGNLFLQLLIGLSGLVLALVQYVILRPQPPLGVPGWIFLLVWPLAALVLAAAAFLEEFIFRGLVQYAALRNLGWMGILFSSGLYAILFLGYGSVLNLFFVFFVGLLFSAVALRTGSILGVSISHALVNILVFLFLPYLAVLPIMRGGVPSISTMTPLPTSASTTSPAAVVPGSVLTPTPCPAPDGWVPYLVEPGDTLASLTQGFGITLNEFLRANCLVDIVPLQVGQRINVPPANPPPTSTQVSATPTATQIPPSLTASPTSLPTSTPQPPRLTPTERPTEPPPPTAPPPTPTERPTEPPPPTPTIAPPTPTTPPPTPTTPPPTPTNRPTKPPPPTPSPAPTQPAPTQAPTPTTAPTEVPPPTNEPTKAARPAAS